MLLQNEDAKYCENLISMCLLHRTHALHACIVSYLSSLTVYMYIVVYLLVYCLLFVSSTTYIHPFQVEKFSNIHCTWRENRDINWNKIVYATHNTFPKCECNMSAKFVNALKYYMLCVVVDASCTLKSDDKKIMENISKIQNKIIK